MEKIILTKLSKDELIDFVVKNGEKKFKAEQIFSWIWIKNASKL